MLFTAHTIPYHATGQFSKIVLDYLDGANALKPFYTAPPTMEAMANALQQKQAQPIDRAALVEALQSQYALVEPIPQVAENIEALQQEHTFTVCTAHQPNLFTGPLYFIFKILHTIKLAASLQQQFPQHRFVPVYYMGSEDADKEELNHTFLQGKKYEWQTAQAGAVGRMKLNKEVTALLQEMSGQLLVQPYGKEVVDLLQACYAEGKMVQEATFELVNALFGKWGLLVLIADSPALKRQMISVFEDDLFRQQPSQLVEKTVSALGQQYNVQANPRDINLFYLQANLRERIIRIDDTFAVNNTDIRFTADEIRSELQQHPERFSPNVILRGLYQETLLPNVAFIGGGGELAYWLQLKGLFDHYSIPFPILVLRNSFLIVEKKWQQKINKLQLSTEQLFRPEIELVDSLIASGGNKPQLNGEVQQLQQLYEGLKKTAAAVDVTLQRHVEALKVQALNRLQALEKKMLRAERRKHEGFRTGLAALRQQLFPNGGLQERVENFSTYYAVWGPQFIDSLLQHSGALEQQFTILTEAEGAL